MGLTGRYDFKGIKKLGAIGIFTLLSTSPMGFLTRGPIGKIVFKMLEAFTNYAANRGLIFLNIAIDNFDTDLDEKAFNKAFDIALGEVSNKQGTLTAQQIKEIDDKVISAFDEFAVLSNDPRFMRKL